MSLKDKMQKLGGTSPAQEQLNQTLDGTTQRLDDVLKRLRERYEECRRRAASRVHLSAVK